MVKKTESASHKCLCQCVAKINAFRRCGKIDEARQWAMLLRDELIAQELLPPPLTPAAK